VVDMAVTDDVLLEVLHDEVRVLRQPADGEDDDHSYHHFHNLPYETHTDLPRTNKLVTSAEHDMSRDMVARDVTPKIVL